MTDSSKSISSDVTAPSSESYQSIAQFAVDLHIARRNYLIYPGTHEQVKRSLTRAYERLCLVLTQLPEITLVVLKGGLAVDGKALPTKNTVFKDLAAVLKQYQIATLVFTQGIEKDELVRFIQLVVTDRETVLGNGGVDTTVAQAGFSHIKVQTVDYSQLHVTEEDRIERSKAGANTDGSIWQQFVTRLTTAGPTDGEGSGVTAQTAFDPGKLARLLNENEMDPALALDEYESVYRALNKSDEQQELISEGLPKFQQMIKSLAPALQGQFLSATFDHCGQLATMADTARLVDGLGADLIVRMLAQASDQGKEISPSLLAFVKKMAYLGAPPPGSAPEWGASGQSETLGSDEVGTLLDREQYDLYVDEGYNTLLRKIISQSQKKATSTESVNAFERELETCLGEVHIVSHVGRAMMVLMEKSHDIAGYRQWARQLTYQLEALLECHAFIFLIDTLLFFRKEKESKDPDKAKIAGLVLDRFNDPKFVARAVEIVQDQGDKADPDAMDFLSALGEPVVVEIFEGLDPNDTFYANDCIESKLLDNLAAFVSCEALERLDDPRPDYVSRMIRIVRRMGDKQGAERVRPLLQHVDMDIRLEALATLLHFGNKWGPIRLRELLSDPSAPELQQVIEMAGQYKVLEALPQLIAYAERGGGDRIRQEAALRALGKIGDSRAIPTLDKLARRRWSMSKKHKHHIKRVVFETLADYPSNQVKDLLHCGLKQKDAAIKACCEQVLKNQRDR